MKTIKNSDHPTLPNKFDKLILSGYTIVQAIREMRIIGGWTKETQEDRDRRVAFGVSTPRENFINYQI